MSEDIQVILRNLGIDPARAGLPSVIELAPGVTIEGGVPESIWTTAMLVAELLSSHGNSAVDNRNRIGQGPVSTPEMAVDVAAVGNTKVSSAPFSPSGGVEFTQTLRSVAAEAAAAAGLSIQTDVRRGKALLHICDSRGNALSIRSEPARPEECYQDPGAPAVVWLAPSGDTSYFVEMASGGGILLVNHGRTLVPLEPDALTVTSSEPSWLKAEMAALVATGQPFALMSTAGLGMRHTADHVGDPRTGGLARLGADVMDRVAAAHRWYGRQAPEMRQNALAAALQVVEHIDQQRELLDATMDLDAASWRGQFGEMLRQREALEGVRSLAQAAGEGADFADALARLDGETESWVASLPQVIPCDDARLRSAAATDVDGWWTRPVVDEGLRDVMEWGLS